VVRYGAGLAQASEKKKGRLMEGFHTVSSSDHMVNEGKARYGYLECFGIGEGGTGLSEKRKKVVTSRGKKRSGRMN